MKSMFISKTELAQAYFPYIDARPARHKLMRVIAEDSELMDRLSRTGYSQKLHLLSPLQVDMIMERLGNPFK